VLQKDSWLIDYQATSNVLQAARAMGVQHFVLLSAICVQKPELEFQKAKLKFEAELQQVSKAIVNGYACNSIFLQHVY
jgi:divinyl chlorophyllide a 8-vinyl-reductase